MRVIITGAGSFIGNALVTRLLARGHSVTAIVRPGSSTSRTLPAQDRLTVLQLEMGEYGRLSGCYDALIHLAWAGARGAERMNTDLQLRNVACSMHTLEAATNMGCTLYMSAGSQAEYGRVLGQTDEQTPCHPETEYGKAKLRFFEEAGSYCAKHNIRFVEPRLFSVYGPNDFSGTLVISTLRRMLRDEDCPLTRCEQLWDFLYRDDAADGIIALAEKPSATGAYNFGYGCVKPLKEYLYDMAEVAQSRSRLLFGTLEPGKAAGVPLWPDIRRLCSETGWQPRIDFREGIRRTFKRPTSRRGADNMNKMLSIVVPTYNEEANIALMCDALTRLFSQELARYDYEIIVIDNHSTDRTREILRGICAQDAHVKAIFNVRNFGQFNSPFYGLTQAKGDAAVLIVADFQDPVEVIPQFVQAWEDGYKIVCGVKNASRESRFMYFLRSCYYKLITRLSRVEQIEHFTGFGLYDRSFLEVLRKLDDSTPFLRGLVAELGGERKIIPYVQERRKRGKTKNNWYTLYDAAMLSFTSYTKIGLRIAVFFGFLIALISILIGLVYLVLKLVLWDRFIAGQAPQMIGTFFLGAVQLFFIGLLGEYILSINNRLMNRPLVIEEERLNFPEQGATPTEIDGAVSDAEKIG